MNPLDDTQLLRYVDGKLSAAERAEVDIAVAHSAEVAERLAALQASVLPYAAAFDAEPLPALPAALSQRVDDLLRSAQAAPVAASTSKPRGGGVRTRWPLAPLQLLGGFAAGAASVGLALALAAPEKLPFTGLQRMPKFVQAVADYHAFYARETATDIQPNAATDRALLAAAQREDGTQIQIPDLRAQGLEFRRLQRLRFDGKAVLQLVYLPKTGTPLALCITQAVAQDRAFANEEAVAWQQGGLQHVLVGRNASVQLGAIAALISSGRVPSLSS